MNVEAESAARHEDGWPEGATLVPDRDLRRLSDGRLLVGGSPLTILTLSPPGRAAVDDWFRGRPVGSAASHRALARRLVRGGLAHVRLPADSGDRSGETVDPFTVVIPVKDDPPGLARTLRSLAGGPRPAGVVVVDDGSARPVAADLATDSTTGPLMLRNERPAGPGPARQRGLSEVTTPLVAFVDAGVEVGVDDLNRLSEWFADPAVVAAAPRIRSRPDDHLVGRYDRHRSPLDLGGAESLVGPGRVVPYVPTACLMARTAAVERIGGFDPALRYGEDVDLVWRLRAKGDIRYVPSIEATHSPRPTLWAMMGQRAAYGSAAAPLADRHGDAVAPARTSTWSAAVLAAAVFGRPLTALAVAAGTAVALRPKIEALPDASVESVLLAGRGHWLGSISLLTALARVWAPAAVLAAALVPGLRRPVATAALAAAGRRLLDGPRSPGAAALDVTVGVADDLAYGVGLWRGVLRQRSARAIRPVFVSSPPHGPKPERAAGSPTRR